MYILQGHQFFLKESCSCTYEVAWVVVGMVYEGILIISTVVLAFLSRNISIKELQSTSTILMAYLLTLTITAGGTIYYITKTIGAETDVPYAILCFSLNDHCLPLHHAAVPPSCSTCDERMACCEEVAWPERFASYQEPSFYRHTFN